MRLISFEDGDRTGYGAVIGQEVARLDCDPKLPTLKSYLARYHGVLPAPESEIRLPLAGLQLLPPIPDPSKIFCVATNYPTPAIRAAGPPAFPLLFTRIAEAQVGGDRDLIKPDVSDRYDFEGELAVVIGLAGRHIPADTAMSHVAGYACFNDGSVRDWQKHSSQFTPGKNFANSGSFGPWLVTVDEVPDPRDLVLTTRVNGQIMQYGEVRDLIFDIPWLISYCSTFAPLLPGDVIVTGTPDGFGSSRKPPRFLAVGDVVEVEVPGVGLLRNTVRPEAIIT